MKHCDIWSVFRKVIQILHFEHPIFSQEGYVSCVVVPRAHSILYQIRPARSFYVNHYRDESITTTANTASIVPTFSRAM